ncbi:MAG: SusC/RagA family TonB-linked outer membrane protein, partial [Bacteroidota bacterium]
QTNVSGMVKDANGTPAIGATVIVTNTTTGTITDINGEFTLEASPSDTLEISYIGFITKKIPVGNITQFDVILNEDIQSLDEVVVTALGIKREKKALGYAVQQIDGQSVSENRNTNLANSLAGRAAGVQVTGANNGLGSSSRIVIRGENSLNINNNSPLIVVDGAPINNNIYGTGGGAADQANMPTDFGNGMADINPDDIASISILKGAAASALYGSRAANGVILITTKSGEGNGGLRVDLSSSLMFSDPLVLPDLQTQYGGGWNQEYADNFGTNFGPAFQGQSLVQDNIGSFLNGEATPFVNRYDLNDFFETGTASNNTLSVSSSNERGSLKVSYGNSLNTGMVPNTNLDRHTFNVNARFDLTSKWKIDVTATSINSSSDNLTVAGYGSQGIMYNLLWNYTNIDLDWLRDYWITPDRQQRQLFTWGDNPFFIAHENINAFEKSRLFGKISSTYQFNENLSFMMRVGTDQSGDLRTARRPHSSHRYQDGMYREQNIDFREVNADFLLTFDKRFNEFSTVFSVGGNVFTQETKENFIEGRGLAIPGIYTLGNINVTPTLSRFDAKKQINSLYGLANLGYMDFLYLDLTLRNDWSSTLPQNNNSYLYPSVSLSVIPTEIIDIWDPMDYLKVRLNFANVGKDTDPFQLRNTFAFASLPNSLTTTDELLNADLKPERTDSYELGVEAYFLDRRVTFDLSLYQTISRDQIISSAISGASGFTSAVINAGEIENKGIEVVLGGTPIQTNNFQWNLSANFTKNRNKVVALADGLESFVIAEGPDGISVEARPGGRIGEIYGNTFLKSPDGQVIYENGLPVTGERASVGNYNPDWMMGINSNIRFKNFSLGAVLDIREGGVIYSYTNVIGWESGILETSLPGRDGIIGVGVIDNGDGTFRPNDVEVGAETYYYGIRPRDNAEANSFDASYIKLRSVNISYNLPKKWIGNGVLKSARVSLVGNNLALWTDVPNIDPEAQAISGGTIIPGLEVTQLPSARMMGFKVDLGF